MKTFTELIEGHLCPFFHEFKTSPQLLGYITAGVPVGIAAYLHGKLYDNYESGTEEVSLDIKDKSGVVMTFKLAAVKKGDSVAFVPSFELGPVGQEYIDSDSVKFDIDDKEALGFEIQQDRELIECMKKAFEGQIYSDGKWIDGDNHSSNNDIRSEIHGLEFDEDCDIALCVATVIYVIIEILCNYKDVSADIEYEVPGLGKFKVSPSKSGYSVTLTIDKEFKGICKSDRLAEKIAGAE